MSNEAIIKNIDHSTTKSGLVNIIFDNDEITSLPHP